ALYGTAATVVFVPHREPGRGRLRRARTHEGSWPDGCSRNVGGSRIEGWKLRNGAGRWPREGLPYHGGRPRHPQVRPTSSYGMEAWRRSSSAVSDAVASAEQYSPGPVSSETACFAMVGAGGHPRGAGGSSARAAVRECAAGAGRGRG